MELPASDGVRDSTATFAFACLAGSAIFLQKLGVEVAGGAIGLDAFILWTVLLWLFAEGAAVIDRQRAVLFLILLCTIAISLTVGTLTGHGLYSAPALVVFLAMYATMLFRIDASQALLKRCVGTFQTGMTVVAFVVIGQQILQYTVGHAYWPNLNRLLPHAILLGGYAYERPYAWNSPYLTPNGVFFLEPSAASGFLALALAAEIVWFKRLQRIGLFVTALLVGMAGSGPTIIALFSPFLLMQMDRRMLIWTIGVGGPLLILAVSLGALSHFVDRSAEFTHDNSSAYARVVIPFENTLAAIADPAHLIAGDGPGSSPKGNNQVQWPADKLISEYGLLTAVAFHIFLVVAVLGGSANRTLTMIVLVPHLFFGGGFVSHTNIMLLVLFGSLLRPASRSEVKAPKTGRTLAYV